MPIGLALGGSFGALLLVVVGLVLYLSFDSGFDNTRRLTRDKARLVIESVTQRIRQHLEPAARHVAHLATMARDGRLDPDDPAQVLAAMRAAMAPVSQIESAIFVRSDLNALLVVRDPDAGLIDLRRDWSTREDYRRAMRRAGRAEETPYWAEFVHVTEGADGREMTLLNVRAPLRIEGVFRGVFVASVQIEELSRYLQRVTSGLAETAFVLSGRESVVAHPALAGGVFGLSLEQPLYALEDVDDPVLAALWDPDRSRATRLAEDDARAGDFEIYAVQTGQGAFIVVLSWLYGYGALPWRVGAYFPHEVFAEGFRRLAWAAGLGLVTLALALLAVLWLGRRIAAPVRGLARAATELERSGPRAVQPLPPSRLRELDTAAHTFNQMLDGLRQREEMRETFGKFVPEAIVDQVLRDAGALAPVTRTATVMFTDIAGFSRIGERVSPHALIELLNEYFTMLVTPIEARGGVIHQFQGDGVLATYNLPVEDPEHAANAVRSAIAIQELCRAREFAGEVRLHTRIGINTGSVVGGTVGGVGRLGYTVHGDAVNVAARIEQLNKQFDTQILLARATVECCAGAFRFRPIGSTTVHGREAPVEVFALDEQVPLAV